jgi:hypothetical protein
MSAIPVGSTDGDLDDPAPRIILTAAMLMLLWVAAVVVSLGLVAMCAISRGR